MIKSIHFQNFKVLRRTTLPLSRFTLIVGPNSSGKSTAMQALYAAHRPDHFHFSHILTAGLQQVPEIKVEVDIAWDLDGAEGISTTRWFVDNRGVEDYAGMEHRLINGSVAPPKIRKKVEDALASFRIFSLTAESITTSVQLQSVTMLGQSGHYLAGVLDNLRDSEPERFELLNEEFGRWLPEFDRILFETPQPGHRAFLLRTRSGKHPIRATDLSQGTLFALTFLTLAYLPDPPAIVCFEEPERGIHPRLLAEIRDAMYRLAYPENCNEQRKPVQVIATTHSPYLLDLYRDHPEEIVIAHKDEQGIHFERLSDKPNVDEFLQDAPLGEVWYSGILGGVPARP